MKLAPLHSIVMTLRKFLSALVAVMVVFTSPVTTAQQTGGSYADFLRALARFESGLRPGIVNQYGYMGLFQMGRLALIDAGYMRQDGSWTCKNGICNQEQFLANPDAQMRAIDDFYRVLNGYIDNFGLRQYIGQTINGIPITESGLLAGAHLVGIGGLRTWLQSNGATIPRDGNGTPITRYVASFGGYNLNIGNPPSWSTINNGTPTGTGGVLPGGSGILTGNPNTGGNATPTGTQGINSWAVTGNPSTVFGESAGFAVSDLRFVIAGFFIALLFLLSAVAYYGTTQAWSKGLASTLTLGRTMMGGAILLSMSIWLVS